VIEADIARLNVEAVVSNDDVEGRMWTAVARAIKTAAGDDVERLAREGTPYRPGQAWITRPGDMSHLRGIVHVASMNRRGESTLEIVRRCLVAALRLAADKGYRSLGVAAIGSGPKAIQPAEWLKAFADVAVAHLQRPTDGQGSGTEIQVVLVLFEARDLEADLRTLQWALCRAWRRTGAPGDTYVDTAYLQRSQREMLRLLGRLPPPLPPRRTVEMDSPPVRMG
jgi:O-acetyl-ADP-ribose deacetylase (regulator of RNase III)